MHALSLPLEVRTKGRYNIRGLHLACKSVIGLCQWPIGFQGSPEFPVKAISWENVNRSRQPAATTAQEPTWLNCCGHMPAQWKICNAWLETRACRRDDEYWLPWHVWPVSSMDIDATKKLLDVLVIRPWIDYLFIFISYHCKWVQKQETISSIQLVNA